MLLPILKLSKGCLCAFKRTTTRTVQEPAASPITQADQLENPPPTGDQEVFLCGCLGEAIQSPKCVTQTVPQDKNKNFFLIHFYIFIILTLNRSTLYKYLGTSSPS